MAINPPAPGVPSGPASPPLDPHALNALLARDPERAAAILAAMRPALRSQQAQAHADLAGVDPTRITQEWHDLIARCGPSVPVAPPDGADAPCASVYEPELLACADPAEVRRWVMDLAPAQRVQQAVAQAAWLNSFGYPVTFNDVLAGWELPSVIRRAG